jgi:SAM-dependent methyltransferase
MKPLGASMPATPPQVQNPGGRPHWEAIYTTRDASQVSWFQARAQLSLELIRRAGAGSPAAIIDVGGGASTLVDDLVASGHSRVSVLDLSGAALALNRSRLGSLASRVHWLEADVLNVDLERHGYDVWHDRAVFHFLTKEADRQRYVDVVLNAVRPGGIVIVATFAEDGPESYSGLPVRRYDPAGLHAELASDDGEHAAHRAQEVFDAGKDGALEFALGMFFAQIQEVEGVVILYRQLGLATRGLGQRAVEVGLVVQEALVGVRVQLVAQHGLRPAESHRCPQVELALQRALAAPKDHPVLRPANFSNQWLEFWRPIIGLIELLHQPQVGRREARPPRELLLQVGSQPLHHRTPPPGRGLTLMDQFTDLPVQLHKLGVHRPKRSLLRGANAALQVDQCGRVVIGRNVIHPSLPWHVA